MRKNGSIYGDDLYYKGIKKIIRKVSTYFFHLLYDAVVVQNKSEIELLRPKRKGVVIENFIEIHNKSVFGDKKNVIIAAGRITPVKGFAKIPEIWKRINKLFPDWKIEIWGPHYGLDDPYYQELLKQISMYSLENSIIIKGQYNDADKTFQRGKIAILTSETDCFPGVILEAMANQLPVVSFDAPFGPRNIIDDGIDGFLIRPDDYSGFADKLKLLMSEDKLIVKMKEAAYEKSLTFSPEVIIEKWMKIFKEINNA
ncbi:glycosyltransferase [Chryseobacterium manosquense]|uniref:Glycosyltransferase n=1 Tax=Chryseobacterium manosquense TaxID=2754694 RepID=A0A7H1DWD4_9FLAO|nr:glycosyltransferase [Chryseobacterium manosquense]QNS41292.1 glycosyltransferase [Chryseobacterium manosquense]